MTEKAKGNDFQPLSMWVRKDENVFDVAYVKRFLFSVAESYEKRKYFN